MTMKIYCFNCGASKKDVFGFCATCNKEPESENDMVLSVLMTDEFTAPDCLEEIKSNMKEGVRPRISLEAKELLLNLLREEGLIKKEH